MRVKIISCSFSTYWYKELIGEEFNVEYDRNNKYVYQVCHDGLPSNKLINKGDCIRVCDPEDKQKKIYFKVYQDVENMNGSTYVTTPEEFMHEYKNMVEGAIECGDDELLLPTVEIVRMTEEEVENLPEFVGF